MGVGSGVGYPNYLSGTSGAQLYIDPTPVYKVPGDVGTTFDEYVTLENFANLTGFDIELTWNGSLITKTAVDYSTYSDALWGAGNWTVAYENSGVGSYELVAVALATLASNAGASVLFKITFQVGMSSTSTLSTPIHFAVVKLSDNTKPVPNPIPATVTDATYYMAGSFPNVYSLAVSILGNGTVTLNNTGPYHLGDVVLLSAVPSVGWSFNSWSGDLSGSANPATLFVTGNMSVTTNFTQNVYTIAVSTIGSGSVTLSLGSLHYGDTVLLTATPATGWVFHYWTGNLSGWANPDTLIITANYSVVAHFIQKPELQISPSGKTCRVYGENFTVAINVSNAVNVEDFASVIHYNHNLLRFVNVTWTAWGSGIVSVDAGRGLITSSTSGTALSGIQTLMTITFQAAYYHIWKSSPIWTNDLSDIIFFQSANVSYLVGPNLSYSRGRPDQIDVAPDFVYTFSPIQGDVNNDGIVDIFDLHIVAAYFNVNQTSPIWPMASAYDLNLDGVVDILDVRLVASNYGYTYMP